jgi:ribose-phosphate pyrophosphokinase
VDPAILTGTAQPELGTSVAHCLGLEPVGRTVDRFPDGELDVAITGSVRMRDVFVVQSTVAPVGERTMELLMLADASLAAGASSVSAVVPYLGCARQDRRRRGHPLGAAVAARMLAGAPFRHLLVVDLHSRVTEGYLGPSPEPLTAVPLLVDAIRPHLPAAAVVVSPDLGAVKLADAYASALQRPLAAVRKTRLSGAEVTVGSVIGEVRDRIPLIVDDMISTGETIAQAARALRAAGARPELYVAASHGPLIAGAMPVLAELGVLRLVTTDSVQVPSAGSLAMDTVSLAPLIAEAIRRLAHRVAAA